MDNSDELLRSKSLKGYVKFVQYRAQPRSRVGEDQGEHRGTRGLGVGRTCRKRGDDVD
ncbi:MAG: hypothetical protein ABI760_08540 [Ferruginibacter sp.]